MLDSPRCANIFLELKKWECLDSATGEALAAAVRKHHLPDFL